MKIKKYVNISHLAYALLATATVQAGPSQLVFPGSFIEPDTRSYTLDPAINFDLDLNEVIDTEKMAAIMMDLLKQPSKSCQEGPLTRRSVEILKEIAAPLGIQISIDDLPRIASTLDDKKKQDIFCNKGKTAPETGNLVAFIPGNIPAPSWNLSFHLDTNQLKFTGIERDGDIIKPPPGSPLGADDKAGIAITAEILRIIRDHQLPHGDIRIVGLVAEEDSAAGAHLVDGDAYKGDIVISIDGSDPDEIGRAAPTTYSGYITVRTATSHPSEVHQKLSVSACAVGIQILDKMGFRPGAHPPGHPDVILHTYFTSCGIDKGRITPKGHPAADFQYNTISPYWTSAWQMRNLEGEENAKKMVAKMISTMNRVCAQAEKGRTKVECKITGTEKPSLRGYVVPENSSSVQVLRKGFELTGENPVRITAIQFGGFNGNHIKSRFNEEMLIVGTGADQTHTNQETVSVKGMARVARGVLASMLESYRYRSDDQQGY